MKSRWTWHGGGLPAAKEHFGKDAWPWLDLSTGINPHRWPGADQAAIDWGPLPDEQALRDLEAAAAHHFGADPDHVCALPGTEIGLRLIGGLLTGGPTCHITPGYRSHTEMIEGAAPVTMEEIAPADGKTLILANPNNPDGRLLDRDRLLAMTARRGQGWLIVDEAFVDTHPESSIAPDVEDERRLIVFRSFGKFFGLAGLRLGFLLGPRGLLAEMRQRLGAWPLSTAAIAIGTAAYRDEVWIAPMLQRLHEEAQQLDVTLHRCGFKPQGRCPLFRLIETDNAMALFERLARQAILVRPFDYAPRWLRIGLPDSDGALTRLEQALSCG